MKLGIINKRNFGKFTNMWMSNNTLLDIQWVKGEITREIRKYFDMNENKNTTNLWSAAKAVFREKFVAVNAYINKEERSQINDPTFHLKKLDKEEQSKPKISIRKEIIKIRVEITS